MKAQVACLIAIVALGCSKQPKGDDLSISSDPTRKPARPRSSDEPAPKPSYASPVIEVGSSGFRLEGKTIAHKARLVDFTAVLGKPDRVEHLANDIHAYESKGLLLYEPPGTGNVVQLTIVFKASIAFDPKSPFAGTLLLEGVRIGPKVSNQKLQELFPKQKWESGLGSALFGENKVYFNAAASAAELENVAIAFDDTRLGAADGGSGGDDDDEY